MSSYSKRELINSPEDCEWLRDTHLKRYTGPAVGFAAAIIVGNMDCPQEIELYVCAEPRITDGTVLLRYDGEEYHRA